ncbi:MAG TPA: 23S rRNA (uracil-5-)-methyltransferase RumA, partial [Chloroflexota bacterium]|nr:23S rRNA (uracil-5-)-methyltransferase RumA [Chloroflexota bacterium]
ASALADAATNAAEFAANNVRFVQADVGASQALAAEQWDLAILDPPRSGCPGSVLEVLDAARLAYASCDPTTLARDLRLLTQRGYRLDSVRLFDMFPQTYHIETLALLSR